MKWRWKSERERLLEEFEEHIENETREGVEAGMSYDQAREAARKKFGNVMLATERSREAWGGVWLERLVQDVRYAVRSLRRAPGYTAALVGTLVLGLGCATAMLAVIESILVRPLALPHSDELAQVYSTDDTDGFRATDHALSYGAIDELRRGNRSFTGVGAYNTMVKAVSGLDGTRITLLTEVTPEFFEVAGVKARLGRLIAAGDGGAPVVVVTDEFWRERLGSEGRAVGTQIRVAGVMRTVIGVLPAGVHVPHGTGGVEVYVPVSLKGSGGALGGATGVAGVSDEFKIESAATLVRLKPGVSMEQARSDAQGVFAHAGGTAAERGRHIALRSYRELVVGDMQRPLWSLLGGVGVLLLIACANAANLQIGRAAGRMPEMGVRSALGASFGRLLQQLITESVLVSVGSAVLGGGLAWVAVVAIRSAYGGEFARFDELTVHPIVLVGTGLLAMLVGVVASLAPALSVRRRTLAPGARTGPRTGAMTGAARGATRKSRLPGVLVSLQVGLTCVLLVVSGLFVRTLQKLEKVGLGFDPKGVTTLVLMPENQNQDAQVSRQMETRLLARFASLPGVESVAMQTSIPFSDYNMALDGTTEVPGRPFRAGDAAFYSLVSTNFVKASGIGLLKGRGFVGEDEGSGSMVVMVNEAFQKKFLEGREPIGAQVAFHRNAGETDADLPFVQRMTVVGVVENELQGGDLGAAYEPMVYIDYLQLPKGSLLSEVFNMAAQFAVRSPLPQAALARELRAAVKEEAPTMIEMSLRPMEEGMEKSLGQRQLALKLVAGFGGAALVLSAVGIYGVLAYSVALRRREIGIRMALGSSRSKVAGLVARQAGWMVVMGLVPGVVGAWLAGRAVRSFLYGVGALDGWTLVNVGVVLVVVSAVAALVPALRAARIDPVETLRAE